MNNKIELPACVLNQISGGADKPEPKKPEPQPENKFNQIAEDTFRNPAFWAIWNWD